MVNFTTTKLKHNETTPAHTHCSYTEQLKNCGTGAARPLASLQRDGTLPTGRNRSGHCKRLWSLAPLASTRTQLEQRWQQRPGQRTAKPASKTSNLTPPADPTSSTSRPTNGDPARTVAVRPTRDTWRPPGQQRDTYRIVKENVMALSGTIWRQSILPLSVQTSSVP